MITKEVLLWVPRSCASITQLVVRSRGTWSELWCKTFRLRCNRGWRVPWMTHPRWRYHHCKYMVSGFLVCRISSFQGHRCRGMIRNPTAYPTRSLLAWMIYRTAGSPESCRSCLRFWSKSLPKPAVHRCGHLASQCISQQPLPYQKHLIKMEMKLNRLQISLMVLWGIVYCAIQFVDFSVLIIHNIFK